MRPTCMTLMVALASTALALPTPQSLEFRAAVTVPGERVTLGDLAAIQPPEAATALAGLDIGPAPLPGGSHTVTVGYVKQRLRHEGLSLSGVAFSGPAQVAIGRPKAESPATPPAASPAPGAPEAAAAPQVTLRSGAPLVLRLRIGDLLVETPGEALSSCVVGTVGRFRVIQTRATVLARLTDTSSAEVLR